MSIAALIVSILAASFTALGLVFVWRRDRRDQARHVWEQSRHEWERESRHRDRTPRLHGGIEPIGSPAWHRLWIELDSVESLTSLRVELPGDAGLQFTPGQDGVGGPGDAVLGIATSGVMVMTQRAVWRIEQTVERKRIVRVVVRCWIGDDEWLVPVDVETPRGPVHVA